MWVSIGSSPTVIGYVFRILELQFVVLKLPICVISISTQYYKKLIFLLFNILIEIGNFSSILEWRRPFHGNKNHNLNASEGFIIFCNFQIIYMLYWRFHFENEIPVNWWFAQWKWTYILDFGPWRWSALNMGFVDKWHLRMQGQWFFQIRAGGQQFSIAAWGGSGSWGDVI